MASYNVKYNSDDSVIRHLIIGFLADLNNKVYFYRQLDSTTRAVIDVPFYYSITGDDEFLRDNFLFTTATGPDCVPNKAYADGNYESIPRGVANLTSIQVDSSKLVNRRNRGQYTRLDDSGSMQGFTAEFEMIPIVMSFDLEILVSSQLDAMKITEMLVKKMYKSNNYNVEVGHMNEGTYRLAAYYALPDDFSQEKPIEYSFEDKGRYKITFSIEVNSFLPAFNLGDGRDLGDIIGEDSFGSESTTSTTSRRRPGNTELHIGNRMFEIRSTISDQNPTEFKRGYLTDDVNVINDQDL
jgi:hypothetical protein